MISFGAASTIYFIYIKVLQSFSHCFIKQFLSKVSHLGFYPGSKPFPTIGSYSFSYFHISSYMLIIFRNLMTFATSHSIPSIFFMSLSMMCFFLSSFYWGQSCRLCFTVSLWFPHIMFLHFGGCSFLDINLLSLILYCLQLLWVLSHSSIRGFMFLSLLVLFSHSLCHSGFPYG